jgi:hypothetical protein
MTAKPRQQHCAAEHQIIAPFAFEAENLMLPWIDNLNFAATSILLMGWLEV